MKPIIKWSGGKLDEIKMFEDHFPDNCTTYIEPFVGGAAVFFHCHDKFENFVISDVHKELISFYTALSNGKARDIHEFMKSHPNDEETYYKVRAWKPDTEVDIASRFYYLRKTCFRGMMRYNKHGEFNIPFGRYKTMNYDCLLDARYEELLSHTKILNKSFEYIFETYDDPSNFVFLDPPYDSVFTDYGYCSFGKEDHERLAELFKKTKNKCLMVIGDTEFIRTLYDGYVAEEYPKKYKFKIHSGRVGDEINTKHLIIKNY